jgi:hypothetical protein
MEDAMFVRLIGAKGWNDKNAQASSGPQPELISTPASGSIRPSPSKP